MFTVRITIEQMHLPTTALLLIQDRKLLLAFSNNKQCYYLPGGKIDTGETATGALCREIAEELNITLSENELEYYTHITAPAYGETRGTIMEQDCFFLHRSVSPQASAEIGNLHYFSLEDYLQQSNKAPGAVMILKQLKSDGFID
jgi:8-oxo-dGTP pyrophosphatase MutT (NUDIX family)